MNRFTPLLAAALFAVLPAYAQDEAADDKSFLENLLQDNLSAAGRAVEITGFAGALSSRATMERLTVADDEGVWLTLEGAVLDWTRSALLGGRLEIDALTADRIEIARRPVAVNDGPQPATSDFALPELPVSIDIGEISADRVVLGETVLGVPTELRLAGRGQLEGGAGDAAITLERIDGQAGRFAVSVGYDNDTRILALDLDLDEGPEGIVATLTGLPGGAPLAFALSGTGPIDDYAAELALATDGAERIGGRVTLNREAAGAPLDFTANLAGDPTPLMAADYRAFFGDDVRLAVEGRRDEAGRLDLKVLEIAADALSLAGSAVIGPEGWPERVQLTGEVAAPGGGPVRLPLGGDPSLVDRVGLAFDFDADRGDDWRAEVTLDGFSRPDVQLARATLTGTGTLTPASAGGLPAFGGHVDLTATGLTGAPDSAATALGPDLTGSFDLARTSGDTLRFQNLTLGGADYRLTGDVTLDTVVEQLDLVVEAAVELAADDLARFAALSGQSLSGAARLRIAGNAALPGGPFDVDIAGTGQDLGLGIPEADRLFAGASTLAFSAARTGEGTRIERLDIRAPGASATGTGWLAATGSQLALRLDLPEAALVAEGLDGPLSAEATALQTAGGWDLALEARAPGNARVNFTGLAETNRRGVTAVTGDLAASVDRLAAWSGLAGRTLSGGATFTGTGRYNLGNGQFAIDGAGQGRNLGLGIPQLDRLFVGASTLAISAARTDEGTQIERLDIRAPGASATGTGWLAETGSQLALRLDLPEAALVAEGLDGPLSAEATALQTAEGWDLALEASAPGGARVSFTGLAETNRDGFAAIKGDLAASVDRLAAWSGLAGRTLSGGATFTGTGRYNLGNGQFAIDGAGQGRDLQFDLGAADRLTGGASELAFSVRRNKNGVIVVDDFRLVTPELSLDAKGRAADEMPRITLEGRLRDLGQFVPGLPGAFTLGGTAKLSETGWQLDLRGDGPGGTAIKASGEVASDAKTASLALKGRAPLALVNDQIAPRALAGMAVFDLGLDGPLAIGSLSGTVSTDGARMSFPTVGLALDPLAADVRLAAGQATVDASARVSTGGRLFVRGPVALSAPYLANLAVQLENVRLRDESLYDLTLGGNLTLAGALANGASITGGLRLGTVELRIPETGFGVDGSLEGLRHVGAPPAVRRTLVRAGQIGAGSGGGGSGPEYGLGITIEAPSAVFVRGRGLDAELGGMLTIGGTTRNVVTTGGVNLIRGRLDILGNRLALTEGSATLRGSLDPWLRLLAETEVEDVSVQVAVDGLASNPSVTFSSSPDLPEDEILARLIFGRGLDQISAFQAVKLASAVATLSGKGGAGTIARLREGFGLDDLDVSTDAEGDLELKAGTYISDNIYTDVTLGADGRAEVNLNLTLTPEITARGSVSSDGATGIGVYFEKDY